MELDGDILAVPVSEGSSDFHGIIKLNEEARAIFDLLKTETTEDAIVDALLLQYSSTGNNISWMVHDFIESLKKENLLVFD